MRMVGSRNDYRVEVQAVQALDNRVDHAFELTQFATIVTQLGDGIHFIQEKYCFLCWKKIKYVSNVLGSITQ